MSYMVREAYLILFTYLSNVSGQNPSHQKWLQERLLWAENWERKTWFFVWFLILSVVSFESPELETWWNSRAGGIWQTAEEEYHFFYKKIFPFIEVSSGMIFFLLEEQMESAYSLCDNKSLYTIGGGNFAVQVPC